MSFVYTGYKVQAGLAGVNLATADMRVMLVMTNTTADTDQDATLISDITTLDEGDGSGYARESIGSGNQVTADDPNDRAEWDASDIVFALLGAGTRQYEGAIIYVDLGADTTSIPVAYIDDDFPFTGNNSNVGFTWNAEGILQFT